MTGKSKQRKQRGYVMPPLPMVSPPRWLIVMPLLTHLSADDALKIVWDNDPSAVIDDIEIAYEAVAKDQGYVIDRWFVLDPWAADVL